VLTFSALVLIRLVFHAAGPFPGLVEIHPGLIAIPLAAICFGASGAWGAALAAPATDMILHIPGAFFSFTGYGMCAFTSLVVWRGFAARLRPGEIAVPALFAFLCGGFSICFWPAFNAAFRGIYPFALVAMFQMYVFAAYALLFFPVIRKSLQSSCTPDSLPPDQPQRDVLRRKAALVWLGGLLSLLGGILVSGFLYQGWPWMNPSLGQRDGWILWIAVLPGLLLQGAAVVLSLVRSRAATRLPADPKFGSFYIPPIRKG